MSKTESLKRMFDSPNSAESTTYPNYFLRMREDAISPCINGEFFLCQLFVLDRFGFVFYNLFYRIDLSTVRFYIFINRSHSPKENTNTKL